MGGFILSSLAFRDLGNPLKRYQYLALPASTFEKFIGMWLLTSVGWILLYTLAYTVYTVVVNPIGHLLFSHVTFRALSRRGELPLTAMKYYFVLQGIFLSRAVYFRGYVLPKTLFTLIVFGAAIGIITYFVMADVFLADHECTSEECYLLIENGRTSGMEGGPGVILVGVGSLVLGNCLFRTQRTGSVVWNSTTIKPFICRLPNASARTFCSKKWKPGDRIPSVREMAVDIEVNSKTVMRTFNYLQDQGIIFNKRGIGYFVSDDGFQKTKDLRKEDFVSQELPNVFKAMDLLNLSMDDMQAYYRHYKNGQDNGSNEG